MIVILSALAACGPRATGSEPGDGSGQVSLADGSYHCVFFIDGSGLQTVPGFSIASFAYRHEDGSGGTVTLDPARSLAEFSGGALNGQTALFEPGPPTRLRLYNEARSRTVVDCDRR